MSLFSPCHVALPIQLHSWFHAHAGRLRHTSRVTRTGVEPFGVPVMHRVGTKVGSVDAASLMR